MSVAADLYVESRKDLAFAEPSCLRDRRLQEKEPVARMSTYRQQNHKSSFAPVAQPDRATDF
jgi:hypothetical protein